MLMKIFKITAMNLALAALLVFFVGFIAGAYLSPQHIITQERTTYVPGIPPQGRQVETLIPAVDEDGNGVLGRLITTVRPGTGLVLVSINDVLAQYDTQYSGRIAARAAAIYLHIDLNEWDIVYNIEVNATAIEGPSAGAAMAVSIATAVQNRTLDPTVSITGTVAADGTIGKVGSVIEKARAAKEAGVRTFLVAPGQRYETNMGRASWCEMRNGTEYCKVSYVETKTDLSERTNMSIVEVATLADALPHFTGG